MKLHVRRRVHEQHPMSSPALSTTKLPARDLTSHSLLRPAFFLIPLFLSLTLTQAGKAGLNGNDTAYGGGALGSETSGDYNSAFGAAALNQNNTGSDNTAIGSHTMQLNTIGTANTASGSFALGNNTAGNNNTASGGNALETNTTGSDNTATGSEALHFNTIGGNNTATGFDALLNNTSGFSLTATGAFALNDNTTGTGSTADGGGALFKNTTGKDNIAMGVNALFNNTTGSSNVALGNAAGVNLTTGSNNIDIGANVLGKAGEANTIRIGSQGTQKSTFIAGISGVPVTGSTIVVNAMGKLGVATSSARFKEQIKPMASTSEAILKLKPVTFRYKQEIDPDKISQFGLIAEDVEKIDPDLITRDEGGKPVTVRYEAVNAMLLNEFLNARRELDEEKATIAKQQKQIKALRADLQVLNRER